MIASAVAPAAAPASDRYDLALSYHARARSLSGTETIRFVNDGASARSTIWLRLWPNGYGSCRHRLIVVKVLSGGTPGHARLGCTALPITLSSPVASGAAATVKLRFAATASRQNDRYGRSGRAVMFGNAIPILALTDDRGSGLPPYTALGESFASRASEWHATLDLPASVEAATTGRETEPRRRRSHHRRRLTIGAPVARDFALAIGPFRIATAKVGSVRIRYFAQRPDPAPGSARTVLAEARRAVAAFSSRFGPYGADELDVVEGAVATFGGMEYPELVMTNPRASAVMHEVAHQWWYGIVGDDEWREPWLDESLASYAERSQHDQLGGCDHARPFGTTTARLDASMSYWTRHPFAYGEVVYGGGACAIASLAADWGAPAVDALLRSVVESHRFGILTTAAMIAAIRDAAPIGYDVDAFLRRAHLAP